VSALNDLWHLPSKTIFQPSSESLDEPVRRYLDHAITQTAPPATAVQLQMTGEIKLKRWMPFTATQVISIDRGFVWSARAKMGLAFISGSDQFIDGVGEMRWKLFGLFPVMVGEGADITRSAGDRYAIERILLPAALRQPEVTWTTAGSSITATQPDLSPITLNLDPDGRIKTVEMIRWGNPDGKAFRLMPFGGYIDEEKTWGGYTIPSRLRIGWNFGNDRFAEGEFFRAHITHAEFR